MSALNHLTEFATAVLAGLTTELAKQLIDKHKNRDEPGPEETTESNDATPEPGE
ncbi:hypothetical protein AB0C13_36905 [Streptomyces sp. NPDC049099]|uniref:hypothetical protein n=1 Tax=Streptomyces sp. NPDC049099 TaxID=3155768 RepID=UPI0034222FC9